MRGFLLRLGMLVGGIVLVTWPIWGCVLANRLGAPEGVLALWIMGVILVISLLFVILLDYDDGDSNRGKEFMAMWILSPFVIPVCIVWVVGVVAFYTFNELFQWLAFGHK